MKIGLNGQHLLANQPAGPETYTLNLFKNLAKLDKTNLYVVYFDQVPPIGFFDKISSGNPNFSYKVLPKKFSWTHVSLALELFKNPVDIFFTAVHTMPIFSPMKTKKVVMIHGLEYKYSQDYKNFLRKLIIPLPIWFSIVSANKIIVPSNATKNEILNKHWPLVDKDKFEVVHEGIPENIMKTGNEQVLEIREKYHIGESDYLFFISTIQPRKNVSAMIEAFSQAVEELNQDLKLVIAGKKGWLYEDALETPKKFGVENKVIFLDWTQSEDVPALFSGAKAFINVSLEEGFGIPLLEAMECKTQCVVSNILPFKEIGLEFPIYVDPKNITSIKNGVLQAVQNPIGQDRIEKAYKHSQEFTWEKTARNTLTIFESLVKNI